MLRYILLGLLIIIILLTYFDILNSYFLADDFVNYNDGVRASIQRLFWPGLARSPRVGLYRPLVHLAWKLCAWLYGRSFTGSVIGHHLFNLILHGLNTILLLYVINELTERKNPIGWLAASLFAVFPLHPEAVTWLSGRFDLQCTFFYLLTLYLYAKFVQKQNFANYLLSLFAFILALLSKELALSLPLMVIVYDFFLAENGRRRKSLLKRTAPYWPFFLISGGYLVLRFLMFGGIGGYLDDQGRSVTLQTNIDVIYKHFVNYFTTFLIPYNREVGIFLPLDRYIQILVVSIFIILYIYLIYAYGRERRLTIHSRVKISILFGLLWICIGLSPVITWAEIFPNLINARFLYLPSMGFCLLLASLLVGAEFFARDGVGNLRSIYPLQLSLIGILAIVYVVMTIRNNLPWQKAEEITRTIASQLEEICSNLPPHYPIIITGAPEYIDGAPLFPEGFPRSPRLQMAQTFCHNRDIYDFNNREEAMSHLSHQTKLPVEQLLQMRPFVYIDGYLQDDTILREKIEMEALGEMRISYDFIDHLSSAKGVDDPSLIAVQNWTIKGCKRRVLYAHPATTGETRLEYHLVLPANSFLTFSLAIAPGAWDKEGDGVAFQIYVEDKEDKKGAQLLFANYIDPKYEGDRKWHDHEVDLTPYGGQEVKLIFVTEGGPKGDTRYDWAGWGDLILSAFVTAQADQQMAVKTAPTGYEVGLRQLISVHEGGLRKG